MIFHNYFLAGSAPFSEPQYSITKSVYRDTKPVYIPAYSVPHSLRQAFNDQIGKQFNLIPFGLRNSPITSSRLMTIILSGRNGIIVFLYLDDLLVVSENIDVY